MKFIKFTLCMLLVPVLAQGATLEEHIGENYNKLVDRINSLGFHEVMAQELSQFALVRQLHEDGPNKKCNYSAVGLYPGDPNKTVLSFVLGIFDDLKKSIIPTPEGTSCYALEGKDACVASATCIALLYEEYVFRFNFKKEERTLWVKSKYGCPDNIHRSEERYSIIKKANNIYGPEGEGIYRQVMKHQPTFERNR